MTRFLIKAAVAASMLAGPFSLAAATPAAAQDYRDVQDARRQLREERQEYNQARRDGDPREVREERRDYREAARDFDRTRDQYQRNRYGRDVYDGDRYDRQANGDRGRHEGWDRGRGNWDRNRYYQRRGDRYYGYTGSYVYRGGRYEPGPGDYYYRDGRYVRYSGARGWYGPNNRYYDDYYRCRRDNNLAGTAIGAALGGVVGNGVAAPGDRTGGAVLGAILGGVLGNQIQASGNRRYCY